jgi:hypothetical protein
MLICVFVHFLHRESPGRILEDKPLLFQGGFCHSRSQHTCGSWMENGPPGGLPSMFVTLMVDALGSPLAPPRGSTVNICHVDRERSRISVSTSQEAHRRRFLTLMVDASGSLALAPPKGVHHRCFLALVVDAPGSSAPAPPRGAVIDVF